MSMHSYFAGPSKLDSSIMDLNTVEVLGLYGTYPTLEGRTSICPIHQVLHEREALFWWIKWFRGPWSSSAYFAFVFSCPRLLYDSECPLFLMVWLPSIPPKGIQDKIGKPRFGLSLISQAGRFFFLTLIGSYQESRSLQLVTIGV